MVARENFLEVSTVRRTGGGIDANKSNCTWRLQQEEVTALPRIKERRRRRKGRPWDISGSLSWGVGNPGSDQWFLYSIDWSFIRVCFTKFSTWGWLTRTVRTLYRHKLTSVHLYFYDNLKLFGRVTSLLSYS